MNIQEMVNTTLAAYTPTLGGETVTIDGTDVLAVIDETSEERELMGGSRIERGLSAQFSTVSGLVTRAGSIVQTRGKYWKIENVRTGQAMTTLTLIEPNRITD